MGGSGSLIGSVFDGLTQLLSPDRGGDSSDALREEREAREREQEREEAEERSQKREKVLEARQIESRRKSESLLTQGAASLTGAPEVYGKALKTKLGE